MRRMTITADMLAVKKACADQVEIFRRLWPRGTTVTLRSCRTAAKAGLNLDWFADNFLPPPALAQYAAECATALAQYDAERAQALAKCAVECARARAKFNVERDKARAKAWKETEA